MAKNPTIGLGAALLISAAILPSHALAQENTPAGGPLSISPWGAEDEMPIDGFGEILLDPEMQQTVSEQLKQSELIAAVAQQRESEFGAKVLGHLAVLSGRTLTAAGARVPGKGTALSAIGIATEIGGQYASDFGEHLLAEAEASISRRIFLQLQSEYQGTIRKEDGTVDFEALSNIDQSTFVKALENEDFLAEVGDSQTVGLFLQRINIDLLADNLRRTASNADGLVRIEQSASDLNKAIVGLGREIDQVQRFQERLSGQIAKNAERLGEINDTVVNSNEILNALARDGLPPDQLLALARAESIKLSPEEASQLARLVSAQEIMENVDEYASGIDDSISAYADFLDPEFVDTSRKFTGLLRSGASLAAAYTMGDPLAMFQAGGNFLGAVNAFGSKPKPDPTTLLLQAVLSRLNQIEDRIIQNHKEVMDTLRAMDTKLDTIDQRIADGFASSSFQNALILADLDELLGQDIVLCRDLVQDFQDEQTQARLKAGVDGFADWFNNDSRPANYRDCLNSLRTSLRVDATSPQNFSARLRARESFGENEWADSGLNQLEFVTRRQLRPAIEFSKSYLATAGQSNFSVSITRPTLDLCSAFRVFSGSQEIDCGNDLGDWTPTNLELGTQGSAAPGGGNLLSVEIVLNYSHLARTLAPWVSLVGRDGRAIDENAARSMTIGEAANKTRHLRLLNSALDALDLVIAQEQLRAGIPNLARTAQVLDEQIIPAYARARILSETEQLEQLLGRSNGNNFSAIIPVAGVDVDCASGVEAYDVLCLMEANPVFGRNAIRAFVFRRLTAFRGQAERDWRNALSGQFERTVTSRMGNDVLLRRVRSDDASSDQAKKTTQWVIELPRVHWDGRQSVQEARTCWEESSIPTVTENNSQKIASGFYAGEKSARCYLIDPANSADFVSLEFDSNYGALLAERLLVANMLANLCLNNRQYPARFCGKFRSQ